MMVSNTINSWVIPVESGEIEKVTISPESIERVAEEEDLKKRKKNGPETIDVFVRPNDIHFRLIYSILKHSHLAQKRMRSIVIGRKRDALCAFPSAVNLRTLSIVWCVF